MSSPFQKSFIAKSPIDMHEGKKHIDPDAPGTPGQPGYEPPVKREDLDTKGQGLYDKLNFQADFDKLQKVNKTKDVKLKTAQTTRHAMPNSYKEGDYVSNDDFEENFKAKKEFPQLSVQDYSRVKKDKKGNSYVTRLKEE